MLYSNIKLKILLRMEIQLRIEHCGNEKRLVRNKADMVQ